MPFFYLPFENRLLKWALAMLVMGLSGMQLMRLESFTDNPERAIDFRNIYIGAQLLSQGENPYNDSLIKSEWNHIRQVENLNENIAPGLPSMGLLYPPPSLFLTQWFGYFSYGSAVFMAKIFLLFQVFIFAFLIFYILQKRGIKIGYIWLCLLLFSLKPTVNIINVGQPSMLFINALFLTWIWLEYVPIKWPSICFNFIALLKPTIGISTLFLYVKNRQLLVPLIWIFVLYVAVLALFPDGSLHHYFLQASGQVAAAYNRNSPEFPYTFEALSNTQIDSVFALFRLPAFTGIIVKIGLLLCCVVVFWRQFKNGNRDTTYWLLICILLSLVLTYHKYYDLLQLLPFVLVGIFSQVRWTRMLSLLTLLHLWLPYSLLAQIGLPKVIPDSLQFANAILPLLWLLLMLFVARGDFFKVVPEKGNDSVK